MASSDDLLNQWEQEQKLTTEPVVKGQSGSDSLLGQWEQQQKSAVAISVGAAVKGNPDQAAEIQRVAKDLRLPADTVKDNWDDVSALAKERSFQMRQMAADDPVLARQYSDINFAAIAYDDVENLSEVGKTVRGLGKKPEGRTFAGTMGDIGITALKGAISLPESFVGIVDIPLKGWAGKQLEKVGYKPEEAKQILDTWYSDAQQQANRNVNQAEGFVGTAEALLENPSVIGTTVLESLPSMLGGVGIAQKLGAMRGLAGNVIGRTAIGEGAIGAGQAAEQIRAGDSVPNITIFGEPEEREKGRLTTTQALAATASGAGTALFSVLGSKVAQRLGIADIEVLLAGKNTTNPALNKSLGRQVVEGMASEGILEEMPQSMQEQMWQNVAEGKPVFEGVPKAGVMGAFAGMAMGGAGPIAALPANIREERAAARAAEEKGQLLENLNKIVAANKVLGRDPEAVQNYVEQVVEETGAENVYVKASVLQQSGMAEQIAAAIPSVGEQLRQIVTPDQEIQIPVAEYTTKIAPTEANAVLVPELRVEGEKMTRREAEEFIATESDRMAAEYDKAVKGETAAQDFRKSAKVVENTFREQLAATGIFTASETKVQAALYGRALSTVALRLKITPEEALQRFNLQVAKEGQPVAGDMLTQATQLLSATPEFKSWFGNSVLKTEDGKPMTLYHGTSDNVESFDLDHPNRKDTGWLGTGVYLTDSTDMADVYANQKRNTGEARPNVMPLYASLENPYMATDEDKARLKEGGREAADAFAQQLQAEGYDGVIYQAAPDAREIVVFDPAKVKSVFNEGSWSPETANILQQAGVNQQQDPTQTPAFKRWSNDAQFISSEEAESHDFKTGEKIAVEGYHGTGRPDRVGTVFKKSRATSGPMAFFTSSPDLASSYAQGKQDTSLAYEEGNYANWFKYKPKGQRSATDIVRAWYQLDNETKAKIREMAPKLRLSEDLDSVIVEEGNTRGNGSYDYNYEQSKRRPMGGNPLEALVEDWLNSGNLFDDEELFMQVLSKAGFPVKDVTYDSPNVTYPGVYKVFVQMQKPLVTNDVPAEVVEALKAAAKTDRSRAAKGGADMWDKKTRTLKEWVAEFLKEGDNAYVWTSIPDKVTKVFESLGYDGIVDWSGKSGGTLAAPVYIPFSEPQVKSAIGNKGTYDLSKKDILKQSDTFYSALQRAFDSAKQDSMPADQWAKWLTGNQSKLGVKKEEIEATGLREYLQLRGNEKLGKAEILNFLTDNGIKIQEVMKGGSEAIDFSEIEELPVPSPLQVVENNDDRMTQYKYAVKTVMDGRFVGYGNTEQEALSDAYSGYPEYWNDMNKADGTKYGQWTLPGGENYKELLLTLPDTLGDTVYGLSPQEAASKMFGEGTLFIKLDKEKQRQVIDAVSTKPANHTYYRSAHWDEANILAHIRFNERTDADGKRVLFIEELQSDWAQAARKGGQVPNAPFIKDTKAWVGLAIKRMLRYAAENGFDKLAFVNGQQSADRYDLSKQIDYIEYEKTGPDQYYIRATDMNGQRPLTEYQKTAAELEDIVGKEIAQKIVNNAGTREPGEPADYGMLRADDLKVGGEGMITFYDKIVPQVANDVLKKLGGGKVEQITLQAGKADAETDALYEDLSGEAAPAPQQRTQLGFTITPEMRDTVMAGQSLFQKEDGGARGYIDPKNLMAILTERADKSTPGHELVHAVVEIYTRIATSENAPAEIVADLQKLLDAYGSGISIDTWAAMSLEDQRPIHEAIAYNWEDYLFTGKAPSIELQSVFDRLSVWIRDLYTSVRDKLNQMYKAEFGVDLPGMTEEVRGVFDRMLASEDQIVQAEAVRNMTPLFQTQEESGMDDATWQAYQQLAQEAREKSIAKLTEDSLRQMRWLSNAKGRVLKEMQRNTAALRKDMRDKVQAAMQFTPIYKAIRFLKSGEQLQEDGTVQKVSGAHKLSISALRELYGENRPARNRFMDFLVQNGISVKDRSDVGGDKGGKYRPGLFRNDGLRLDELAYLAFEEGYLTEADMQSERDTGGVNKLADLIQRALSGERILTTEQQMAQDEKDVKAQQREQAAAFDAFGEENAVSEEEAMRSMGYTDEQIAAMMATPDWRKLGFGKYGMLAADGIDPDVLAERFGFGSGDELVRTLIATPSLKEAVNKATDEAMLMQYGDMYDKRQIDLAVERALHTEARARFLATELRFIAKATAPARIMVQAAKRAAMNSIAGRLIKDVKPSQYSIAEARANKEAQAAQKKGDDAAVAMALQTALLNNQLTAVATGVVTEIDKGLAYLRKVTSDANRKRIGADHADQIDAILERFELKPISLKEIGRRQSLAEWIESQREAGLDPQIPPDMADAAFRKPFKMMTVQEFRDLMDAIQQIEHLGRNQQMMLTAAKDTAYKAARDEMVASINDNAKGRKADTRTAKTKLGKMAQGMQRFFAEHIKAASIARILDGGKDGGPVWEYLIRPANAAADRETEMRAEATRDITAILAPILKSGKLGGKGTVVRSMGRAFNKEERIAIALNMGNEGNLQRLLDGEGWTIEQVTPVLESLTTAELEAVQKILDYSEEKHKPLIAAQWRKLYGKEPEWVAPRAMTVKSADGDMVTLRGGYYPIVYDPRASQRANELYDAESARMEMQGFISATINTSFSKSRVQAVKERPLLLSLAGVYNGINDVIHALAWQEFIIDANRLLRSHSIDQAIRTQYGPEYKQQLKEWIKDVAVGERKSMDGGAQAVNFVRRSVSAAGLGFNIMSALQQVTGFSSSIVRLGTRYVGRGVAKTMANPSAAIKDVYAKSTFMANRGRTQFRELNELRNMVQGETAAVRNIKLGTYFMMAQMQRMVDVPTWIGAYEKAIAEGNDEDKAIAMADQSVIDSQGGGMLKDLSKIERGGPWLKLFTVFYSYMNTQLNLATVQAMTAKSKGKLAADMLMLTLVPVVLAYAIKHGLTPDDEDKWDWEKIAKDLAAENLAYLMGSMIIVRELGNAAKVVVGAEGGARGYGGPAGTRMISDLFTFATQAQQGEFDTAFRKAAINLLGDFTGLPSAQINRTINGIDALVEGDTSNPAAVLTGFEKK